MKPIELGIGEVLDVPVDLDTSAFSNDYTVASSGIVMRMVAAGSKKVLFESDVTTTDATEGTLLVNLLAADTATLVPGAYLGEVIDPTGPFRLTTLSFVADYLAGVLPVETQHIYVATENRIGENVVVVRGEDYTGEHALVFQVSREVEDGTYLFAVIEGERYAAALADPSTPRLVSVELDYTDTAEFSFTAGQFLIVEVPDPELDPDLVEDSAVNTLYDAIITVREG